jgi:hypothetical protein
MSYYIDIIDTVSPLTKLVVEKASASGIELKWNGSDAKDEMYIVTSEFNFDMLTLTAKDAAFIGFFTGDEHRFKVLVKNNDDDSIIWSGYILPDLYSEPYKNGVFFVNFTASDGLGRLKGKKLPDDYYSKEKSLIDIFCQCLKLTGHELDLYFNPAIENFVNKDWDSIFIDTATFAEKDKKKDAFEILETLMKDTLCLCYQCDNRWYIEGINTRHIREVTYKKYDTDGNFVNSLVYNRLLKSITALASPTFTIIPPYNEITITHKKTEPSLPGTLAKETNDGWAIVTGVNGTLFGDDWRSNGGLFAICKSPNFYCTVYSKNSNNINAPQDDSQFISLKEKIFLSKGQKAKMSFVFKIKRPGITDSNPADMLLWKNPFKYEILFNGLVLYSNFGGTVSDVENVVFSSSAEAKIDIEHIFLDDGLFDVRIYGPPGTTNINRIEGIYIESASIDIIAFKDEEIVKDVINGDFTIDKDLELTFADDQSGMSKGFRLYKLKEQTANFVSVDFPILYGFVLDGKNYSVVDLQSAFAIKNNRYQVTKSGVPVNVIDVVYNLNDGEQMVIQTAVLYEAGDFSVKIYAVDDLLSSRTNWTKWTDSVYKIENTTFIKTVANIYRRLFNQAHEKMDCTALNAVKFNDICLFNYVYAKDFIVLNCAWNLDDNRTTLTLGRSYYKDSGSVVIGDSNIPPIVLAGDDIYLENAQTSTSLLATAFDPDGYIYAQQWKKTVGGFGDIIETPAQLATNLSNLTEDYYTYQIQVTDNGGATAMDTINVIRKKDYSVTLDLINEIIESNTNYPSIYSRYKVTFSPEIAAGFVFTLKGRIILLTSISGTNGVDADSIYSIVKNGAVIETGYGSYPSAVVSFTLNYVAGDVIYIDLTTSALVGNAGSGDTATASATVILDSVLITTGVGVVVGLPINKNQTVNV